MRIHPGKLAAVVVFALFASPSYSATTTGIMAVTAVAVNACTVAATPLAFGTINQLGGASNDSTAIITVTCTPGTGYSVGLDQGLHASGGVRQMQGALSTNLLPYTLFRDANHAMTWGNTIGTDTVSGVGAIVPATLTVYGRIPGSASLATAGAYSDAVTVTVTF